MFFHKYIPVTCGLGGRWGVLGGQTRLLCAGGLLSTRFFLVTNWYGPGSTVLVTVGIHVHLSYSVENGADLFYLVITDRSKCNARSKACNARPRTGLWPRKSTHQCAL